MKKESDYQYPCPAVVWELYRIVPDYVYFGIDVISSDNDAVIESLRFSKNDEHERKQGQKNMYALLGRYSMIGYRKINLEWVWGLGSEAIIQIVVDGCFMKNNGKERRCDYGI